MGRSLGSVDDTAVLGRINPAFGAAPLRSAVFVASLLEG
jgi:hypothetical protein